jgi:hypothetical protein
VKALHNDPLRVSPLTWVAMLEEAFVLVDALNDTTEALIDRLESCDRPLPDDLAQLRSALVQTRAQCERYLNFCEHCRQRLTR